MTTSLSSLGASQRALTKLMTVNPEYLTLEGVLTLTDEELRTYAGYVEREGFTDRSGYGSIRKIIDEYQLSLLTPEALSGPELDEEALQVNGFDANRMGRPSKEHYALSPDKPMPEGYEPAMIHEGHVVLTVGGRRIKLGERDGESIPFVRLYNPGVPLEELALHRVSIYTPVKVAPNRNLN